ncbi:MAG: enoyl-CoA hydratase/isomerase family protein [Citricoccus sp.]|jgi:2-(1,2-epoxy-1,2-dihydrophenyl)acetyl-CoA isomerase|nr:enoyl-CoA hydratase/isomerase family protein [Citricoccus sp. WCRC_4]
MTAPLRVERREGVVRLVMDRTAAGNALDEPLAEALATELERAEADPRVRVLTVTGRDRFFCAGGDVRSMASVPAGERHELLLSLATATSTLMSALSRTRLLVVAGVNGATAGAGLGLLLAADWVLASDEVKIVGAFAGVGLTPDTGVSYLLPRTVGYHRAVELTLGGRRLGGAEAVEWGLASQSVPAADFAHRLTEAEDAFVATPDHVVGPTKALLRAGRYGADWEEHLRAEARSVARSSTHPESVRLVDRFAAPAPAAHGAG